MDVGLLAAARETPARLHRGMALVALKAHEAFTQSASPKRAGVPRAAHSQNTRRFVGSWLVVIQPSTFLVQERADVPKLCQ